MFVVEAGPPGQPKFEEITPDQIKLSWDKPADDGGGDIKGYVVEKKKKDGDWEPATTTPVKGNEATVPVKEGEEYEFRVKAVNEMGPGHPSRPTARVRAARQPMAPQIELSKVKDIRVKQGKNIAIKVPYKAHPKPTAVWKAGDHDLADSKRTKMEVTDFLITMTTTGAQRGDAGKYVVKLTNDTGSAEASLNVTVLSSPLNPEGPLKATEVGPNHITVAWKPPKDNGGSKIEKYVLEKKPKGSNKWQKVPGMIRPHENEATARNLEKGEEYDFRVVAVNENGESEPLETSEAIKAKHPFDPPGKPGTPECDGTTTDSISLKWAKPTKDGGKPIKGYVVEKREKGTNRWTKLVIFLLLFFCYIL